MKIIKTSEALPKSGRYVLAWLEGAKIPMRAMWADQHTLPLGDDADPEWGEYSEEKDEYFCPAGWYEMNQFEEQHWGVSGNVVAWCELPRLDHQCLAQIEEPAQPVLYVSADQLAGALPPEKPGSTTATVLLPVRKTPGGKFTQPLYAGAAPAAVAPQGEYPHEQMDAMALARYKVVPSHASMLWSHAVVAGHGTQQLYVGREVECQNMVRKFAGAFLDGAFAFHSTAAAPTAQAAPALEAPAAPEQLEAWWAAQLAAAPQAPAQEAPAVHTANGTPPLTPDEARWAAQSADRMRSPSDVTSGTEYAMAGAMALAKKLAAAPVDDLAQLVKQLVRALRKAAPGNDLADKALDYLRRQGLQGSPLRAAPAAPINSAPPGYRLQPISEYDAMCAAMAAPAAPSKAAIHDAAYCALQYVEHALAAIANREELSDGAIERVDTIGKASKRAKVALTRLQAVAHHFVEAAPAAPDDVLCYIRPGATLPERNGYEVCRSTDAGAMAVMGDGRVAAPAVPAVDAFTHAELLEIQRAVSEFEDCNETDVDDALLLRAVQAGYLECSQYFHVADKSKLDSDTAAAQAKEGGA